MLGTYKPLLCHSFHLADNDLLGQTETELLALQSSAVCKQYK